MPYPHKALRMADGGLADHEPMVRWAHYATPSLRTARMADGGSRILQSQENDPPVYPYGEGEVEQRYMTNLREMGFADGGSFLTRFFTGSTRPGQALTGRAAQIEQQTNPAPPPAPAPVAQPVTAPVQPVDPNNPAGIRFANGGANMYADGSLHGGRVAGPGTGVSDSVPAHYSDGEYVLPKDTAQAIGYDKLDAIKDATHTPAAVQRGHRGLRMVDGGIPGMTVSERLMTPQEAPLFSTRAQDGQPGYTAKTPNVPPVGMDGVQVNERPMTGNQSRVFNPPAPEVPQRLSTPPAGNFPKGMDESVAHGQRVNPAPAPDGRYGLPPNPTGSAAPAAPASPAAPSTPQAGGIRSALRTGASAIKSIGVGLAGGLAGEQVAKAATGIGAPTMQPAAPQSDAVSQIPTDGYAKAPEAEPYNFFTDNEAGRNIGNLTQAASMLPGGSAVRGALRVAGMGAVQGAAQGVRETMGSSPTAPAAAPANGANPYEAANNEKLRNAAAVESAAPVPPSVTFGGKTGTAVDGEPGVSKFKTADGRTLYSNVSGPNDKFMSNKPGVQIIPGFSGGPGSTFGSRSAMDGDNAIRAANLRDGVDINRGVKGTEDEQLKALAVSPFGTPGRAHAQRLIQAREEQAVVRRGQDIQERVAMAPALLAAQQRAMMADIFQRAGGDRVKAANMADASGLTSVAKEFREGTKAGNDIQDTQQKNRSDAENQQTKNLETRYRTKDDKGADIPDHQKVALYKQAAAVTVPELAKELHKRGVAAGGKAGAEAVAKAKDLIARGPAALDDKDHEDLQQLFDIRDRMAQSRGMLYGSAGYTHSDNLLDYRQLPIEKGIDKGIDRRAIGQNHMVNKMGHVSFGDLRNAEGPSNPFLPDINKLQTNNLIRGLRQQ